MDDIRNAIFAPEVEQDRFDLNPNLRPMVVLLLLR